MTERTELTAIGRAIERAAKELPPGWGVRIDLEKDAGTVYLTSPNGAESMIEGGELFSDQINSAIDAAMAEGGKQ